MFQNGDVSLIQTAAGEKLENIAIETDETNDTSNDEIYEELHASHPNKRNILKTLFYVVIPIIYGLLLIESCMHTSNAYHVFSWLAILFTLSYVLCIIHTVSFSTKLCRHTIDYEIMNGIASNYIPSKLNVHTNIPWKSMSHVSHIRGSSISVWHSALINGGSFAILSGVIMKLFDLRNNTLQENVAVYMLLCGGLGGLIIANTETYTSPSFSRKYNLYCDIVHQFGVFNYALIGNLAFAVYNSFDLFGCCLLITTICVALFYRINRRYRYRKNLNNVNNTSIEYDKWVHNMSVVNIVSEIAAIVPSAIAMCVLVYQFGDE